MERAALVRSTSVDPMMGFPTAASRVHAIGVHATLVIFDIGCEFLWLTRLVWTLMVLTGMQYLIMLSPRVNVTS